jgi:hypothetical protein
MHDRQTLSEADFRAADEVLARLQMIPPLESPAHAELRKTYASMHAAFGADKFALRVGLREPRSPHEELEVLFFSQQITQEEYRKRLKEYATRPVDRPMLQKFFKEFEAALNDYGGLLQLIVEIATDQHDPDACQYREGEVDSAIVKFDAKYDLFSTELKTVLEFLTRVQSDRQEPIKCGDYIGDSSHWIAMLVFSHASQAWKRSKEIADRSMTDPHFLYSMNAAALFFKTWIEPNKLPRPNNLAALLRSEQAKAIAKFDAKQTDARPAASSLAKTVQPVHFEDFSGQQFERLVFAYHLRTEKWRTLEWYGQSGSDLGRDIWGKRESGRSLCIQCVNRKTTAASKVTRDLDKIVQASGGIPDEVLVVCASGVSAKLRDKLKEHAGKRGVTRIDIWSGPEFEERLRKDAESLLKRFIGGETFPDDPSDLAHFIANASPGSSTPTVAMIGSINNGIIANQVTIRNSRPSAKAIIVPGSIGADPEKYNYVEYLLKQLAKFREAGASYGQQRGGRVHPGSTRKILERQLGGLPKDLAAERFLEVCCHLKSKIDDTAQGRNNRKSSILNYHSFEEHGSKQT